LYEIKIDNNADGVEDITYQLRFTSQVANPNTFLYNTGPIKSIDDANRNLSQSFTLTRLDKGSTSFTAGPMKVMYDNVGPASTPNFGGNGSGVYEFKQPDGTTGRVFAGQTDDPFFLDLRVFDLLYGGNLSEVGTDSLAGFNVHSIAIQVPKSSLRAGSPIIGVWSTASRPTTTTRTAGSETTSGSTKTTGNRAPNRWSLQVKRVIVHRILGIRYCGIRLGSLPLHIGDAIRT
jgi:hypothetical protein